MDELDSAVGERLKQVLRFVARQPRLGQDGVEIRKMLHQETGEHSRWDEFAALMGLFVSSGLLATREGIAEGRRVATFYCLTELGWQKYRETTGNHQPSPHRRPVGRKSYEGSNEFTACRR